MTAENQVTERSLMEERQLRSRRRMRKLIAFGIILGIVFGPFLFYRLSSVSETVRKFSISSAQPPINESGSLKVMVWNIAHGRGAEFGNWNEGGKPKVRRLTEIAAFIRQQQADIVVLNEVDFNSTWSGNFDQAAAIAELAGYSHYVRQCNLDFGTIGFRLKAGNVVMSKFPIESATVVDLPPHKNWESWLAGKKRGIDCLIRVGKKPIHVLGLHLESRSRKTRIAASEYLLEYIQDLSHPVILAGDLNSTWSAARRQEETTALDLLIEGSKLVTEPTSIYSEQQYTFPTTRPDRTIDWVLCDGTVLEILTQEVLRSELSDHLPVVQTMRIREP